MLFSIKAKIRVLIKWLYRLPQSITLTIESRMVNIFQVHRVQSLQNMMPFLVFVLRSTPNHIPLECRCNCYRYVGFRHVYLTYLNVAVS